MKKTDNQFIQIEHKWQKHWEEKEIYKKYLEKNSKSDKRFSFFDGPITANNPMGVHHAWGRTYKDLWQKFYNLLGFKQRFQNGFDCQGLWVEVEVEKELGLRSKRDIENLESNKKASIAKFVQLCKDRVYKYSKIQSEQSQRLGYFMDWNHSYFTMSDENNYMIWHFLKVCYENGWLYKGKESVPWCPRCQTAISQHEMLTEDYKEVVHDSLFIKVPIIGRKNEYLLFWTTTPWTIPANIAIAVNEKLKYALVEGTTGNFYWLAKDRVEKIFKKDHKGIKKTVFGKELIGLKYEAPFDHLSAVSKVAKAHAKKFHTVVATDPLIMPISTTEGTGLVHTAVSAGTEDFKLGKKYGLPMIPVITDDASYLEGFGEFSCKNAKKHPELIIDFLKKYDNGKFLFDVQKYKHRYPGCWRCKTELVWKVEDEWYIAMDIPSKSNVKSQKSKVNATLRERMVEVAKKIRWKPEFGLDRELDWLKNMNDWLISKKNRYWGLALPIYECKKCGKFEVIGSKEELKQRAVKGWEHFEGKSPHKPFIDEVIISCKSCNKNINRIEDVGNPWLDAGIIPFSTLVDPQTKKLSYTTDKKYFQEWFPAHVITESFPGQFKNWFYSLIAMSTVLENTNSFKTVLGYGTLLGEDGRPMHKSWGNAIEFNEGADKIGVDVMRWLFIKSNPAENLLFGYKKTDEVRRQFYLILWNVYKFYIEYSQLDKFKNQKSRLRQGYGGQAKSKNILDKWIINRLVWLTRHVEKQLKEYNPKEAAVEIEKFVSDLSIWYIRRSRDRVWTNSDNLDDKKHFYETLRFILIPLSIILSPFMPFISEEIFTSLTSLESVHLSNWPDFSRQKINDDLITDMNTLRTIVEAGHSKRKELQIKVRQPLAKIEIMYSKKELFKKKENVEDYYRLLSNELNVKYVVIIEKKNIEMMEVVFDTYLTEDLIIEGKLRDLLRQIQQQRKQLGVRQDQYISVVIPKEFARFKVQIQKKILSKEIKYGNELKILI